MKRLVPLDVYEVLLSHYGEQHWWPAETPFEMMVGAILTQNTRWENVEMAIENLRRNKLLDPERMGTCNQDKLAELIRSSGFFKQKSKRLYELCLFYMNHGGVEGMKRWPTASLRAKLLDVHGIGPETADSILLYALERPIFVVDAYTKRIFSRLGFFKQSLEYDDVQAFLQKRLPATLALYQEFHALIVAHAKAHCRSKPECSGCPLAHACKNGFVTP